jgi:phosphocarrier protein
MPMCSGSTPPAVVLDQPAAGAPDGVAAVSVSDTADRTLWTDVVIKNPLGLHARPAMSFVDTANGFKCEVRVHKADQSVDGKSIMQMMMLAATQGTKLRITAQGSDAQAALAALADLVDRQFDEA